MLIRVFGSAGTQPASVVIVCNFTSWVIYICIQQLEKPSESVITSLMRVSSWNRAKMETDCKNLILLRCLAFHSAYAHVLSSPEHDISAVAQRQEKNEPKPKQIHVLCFGWGSRRWKRAGIMVKVSSTLSLQTLKTLWNILKKKHKACLLTHWTVCPDWICITCCDLHFSSC